MMDSTSLFQDVTDVKMFETHSNYRCPLCSVDMMIAGRYDRSEGGANGKARDSLVECCGCGKIVKPVKRT